MHSASEKTPWAKARQAAILKEKEMQALISPHEALKTNDREYKRRISRLTRTASAEYCYGVSLRVL
jgi:hypothetical protein